MLDDEIFNIFQHWYQGKDSLSSLLFNIVLEVLTIVIRQDIDIK